MGSSLDTSVRCDCKSYVTSSTETEVPLDFYTFPQDMISRAWI